MLIDSPVYVVFTTTEAGGEGDIVRIRALKGAEISEPFYTLAQSGARLTMAQARNSGLTNSLLDKAPGLSEALQDLIEFSGEYKKNGAAWIVPEGVAARKALVRAADAAGFPRGFGPSVIGVDELGVIALPRVCRQGIGDLKAYYKIEDSPTDPTQDIQPETIRTLWMHLEEEMAALPLPLLAEMGWLMSKGNHPLKAMLKRAETQAVQSKFGKAMTDGKLSLASLFKDFTEIVERLGTGSKMEPTDDDEETQPFETVAVDLAEVTRLLGPDGPLSKAWPGYENRREQMEMAVRVARAMNDGKHLLSEAGTGVGKSLAYLIPAVLYGRAARRPVVISTHTKNLQAQLFYKDLPTLKNILGLEFNAALLKGRPNYLCNRKFMYLLQEASHELEDEERLALLPVMTWATQTSDGDVSELAAFSPEQNSQLWDRLHTVGEDCLAKQCPFYNRCFVYKARGLAHSADVVVTNHSLVFSGLNQEHGALPPFQEIVFDEAHTLEDVATSHLACEVTPRRAGKVIQKLYRTRTGQSGGKGLLTSLLFQLDLARPEFPEDQFAAIHTHVLDAIQAVAPAEDSLEAFFGGLRDWFEHEGAEPEPPPGGNPFFVPRERGRADTPREVSNFPSRNRPQRKRDSDVKRFSGNSMRPEEAAIFTGGKEPAIACLGRLRQALNTIVEDFKEIRSKKVGRSRELQTEITAQMLFLQELIHDLEFVTKGDEPNYVYWVERHGRRSMGAVAAPLDLAALLHEQLYELRRSIIFASATLSVRDETADAGAGLAPMKLKPRPVPKELPPPPPDSEDLSPPADWTEERPHPKSFEFVKRRIGLNLCEEGKLDELQEGSPFDYQKQCKLYIPTFLPEPGGGRDREFDAALATMTAKLAIASGGRAMVLFTSYASLNANARILRPALAAENIEVLAQGEDGSREALLARLKQKGRSVLLGTASFWEGVDVPGDALSLLIIAKLPFAVFTDPLVQGRCEMLERQGKDPFLHYSVPQAILKLRQGFGRLIRSKTDKGIAVLCDKRVLTKRYGAAFLRALPVKAEAVSDAEQLAQSTTDFLAP